MYSWDAEHVLRSLDRIPVTNATLAVVEMARTPRLCSARMPRVFVSTAAKSTLEHLNSELVRN